jgi:hypothetical protein
MHNEFGSTDGIIEAAVTNPATKRRRGSDNSSSSETRVVPSAAPTVLGWLLQSPIQETRPHARHGIDVLMGAIPSRSLTVVQLASGHL